MRKKVSFIWLWAVLFLLCACGKKEPTWQEQYDLGMKYLNTGDYEEAVTAFQVAISIDPKQQPAYIGAADAYMGMAGSGAESIDVEKCYEAAEENYRKALDIDSETEEVYEKLADMYVESGNTEKAEELIGEAKDKGQEGTWADELLSKLDNQEPAQEESGQHAAGLDDVPEREWKQAYLDYIKKEEAEPYNNDNVYRFLDINGDTLPELYIDRQYLGGGGEVCSYINGKVVSVRVGTGLGWGVFYIEGENIFMSRIGKYDYSMDVIYRITNDGMEQIAYGELEAVDVNNLYDEDGNGIFGKFTWNGESVNSREEYDALLDAVFDRNRAICMFDGLDYSNVYDYDSFKTVISNY